MTSTPGRKGNTGFSYIITKALYCHINRDSLFRWYWATIPGKISHQRPGIPFIPNHGQLSSPIRYYAYTDTGIVYVTRTGEIIYALSNSQDRHGAQPQIVKERIAKARVTRIEGRKRTTTSVNYFQGDKPQQWKQGIPTYQSVSLGHVYPGIEVLLKAHDNAVEKLFVIGPALIQTVFTSHWRAGERR